MSFDNNNHIAKNDKNGSENNISAGTLKTPIPIKKPLSLSSTSTKIKSIVPISLKKPGVIRKIGAISNGSVNIAIKSNTKSTNLFGNDDEDEEPNSKKSRNGNTNIEQTMQTLLNKPVNILESELYIDEKDETSLDFRDIPVLSDYSFQSPTTLNIETTNTNIERMDGSEGANTGRMDDGEGERHIVGSGMNDNIETEDDLILASIKEISKIEEASKFDKTLNGTALNSTTLNITLDSDELGENDYTTEHYISWAERQAMDVKVKDFSVMALPADDLLPPIYPTIYREHADVRDLKKEDIENSKKLHKIRLRGLDIPNPVSTWDHCGLPSKVLEMLKKDNCLKPFPIQQFTLPIIMTGRDCIACAKTGSGKTLAFTLPLIRHVLTQKQHYEKDKDVYQNSEKSENSENPDFSQDGPIAMVISPTRELCTQSAHIIQKLGGSVNLRIVAAYGGSDISSQIALCKLGAEIMIGTPGRILDLLTVNRGRVANLRKMSYLVLDEADRMFDMGFEPQILKIIENSRKEKQTLLFSATFPKNIENLARKVLKRPIEVVIGGKSIVNDNIQQIIDILPDGSDDSRLLKVLEILGLWAGKGNILIFADTQDTVVWLFMELLRYEYSVFALHGGMDQLDRETNLQAFKAATSSILIATSIASRGLDVKDLVLVLNYNAPNHLEDYVHRVGRTGRAGNKGVAITLLSADGDDEAKCVDVMKALKMSNHAISSEFQAFYDTFMEKVAKKEATYYRSNGYKTSGYTFDLEEAEEKMQKRKKMLEYNDNVGDVESIFEKKKEEDFVHKLQVKKMEKEMETQREKEHLSAILSAVKPSAPSTALPTTTTGSGTGAGAGVGTSVGVGVGVNVGGSNVKTPLPPPPPSKPTSTSTSSSTTTTSTQPNKSTTTTTKTPAPAPVSAPQNKAQDILARLQAKKSSSTPSINEEALRRATAAAAKLSIVSQTEIQTLEANGYHIATLYTNDYPPPARLKVLRKDYFSDLFDQYAVSVEMKGTYYPPVKNVKSAREDRLHVSIVGKVLENVQKAKNDIFTSLEEAAMAFSHQNSVNTGGKYNVV